MEMGETHGSGEQIAAHYAGGRKTILCGSAHERRDWGDNLGVAWQLPAQLNPPPNGSDPIRAPFLAGFGDPTTAGLSIIQHPTSTPATFGATATFSVSANSAALPMFYQWQKNGIDIPGANSPSFTTPIVTAADNGQAIAVL
jgi:hypothetical protein